jgi:hypothetical protein
VDESRKLLGKDTKVQFVGEHPCFADEFNAIIKPKEPATFVRTKDLLKPMQSDFSAPSGDGQTLIVTVWCKAEQVLILMDHHPRFAGILCLGPPPETTAFGVTSAQTFYNLATKGGWVSVRRALCQSKTFMDINDKEILELTKRFYMPDEEESAETTRFSFSGQELFVPKRKVGTIEAVDPSRWHQWCRVAPALLALSWASRLCIEGVCAIVPDGVEDLLQTLQWLKKSKNMTFQHALAELYKQLQNKPEIHNIIAVWHGMGALGLTGMDQTMGRFWVRMIASRHPTARMAIEAELKMYWNDVRYSWPYVCAACLNQCRDMKRCSKCQKALYCGPKCQITHWTTHHKTMCCQTQK